MMPLEAGGYFYQQGSTLNVAADSGFKKRMKLFLKEGSSTVYSGEAATMCGPVVVVIDSFLLHDLFNDRSAN